MKLTLAFFGLALSLYGQTTIDIDTGKRAAYRIPRQFSGPFSNLLEMPCITDCGRKFSRTRALKRTCGALRMSAE